jgi:hypothetical protein
METRYIDIVVYLNKAMVLISSLVSHSFSYQTSAFVLYRTCIHIYTLGHDSISCDNPKILEQETSLDVIRRDMALWIAPPPPDLFHGSSRYRYSRSTHQILKITPRERGVYFDRFTPPSMKVWLRVEWSRSKTTWQTSVHVLDIQRTLSFWYCEGAGSVAYSGNNTLHRILVHFAGLGVDTLYFLLVVLFYTRISDLKAGKKSRNPTVKARTHH